MGNDGKDLSVNGKRPYFRIIIRQKQTTTKWTGQTEIDDEKKETKPIGRSDNKNYEEIQRRSGDSDIRIIEVRVIFSSQKKTEVSHSGNCKWL